MYTEWEFDDGNGGVTQTFKPPWWYKPNTDPCACGVAPIKIDEHAGFSDELYLHYRCPTCGHEWSAFLEG